MECADLVRAALKASREYHQSLEALESAHIRNELNAMFRLRAELEAAARSRDSALTALHGHLRIHASDNPGV